MTLPAPRHGAARWNFRSGLWKCARIPGVGVHPIARGGMDEAGLECGWGSETGAVHLITGSVPAPTALKT